MHSLLSVLTALLLFAPQTFAGGDKVVKHTVIDFTPGQATLSAEDTDSIRSLVKESLATGKVTRVEVAVWADKDYPVRGDLSKADQTLARDRAENIKNALRMSGNTETVKVFNMANSSNWLARTFKTADAELDSVFAKQDAEIKRDDFKVIKDKGAPSKAVVIMKMKDKPTDTSVR